MIFSEKKLLVVVGLGAVLFFLLSSVFNIHIARADVIGDLSDTLEDSAKGEPSNHTIAFTTANGVSDDDSVMTLTFSGPGDFDMSSLVADQDIEIFDDGNPLTVETGGCTTANVNITVTDGSDEIDFQFCSGNGGAVAGGSVITILIGDNATGGVNKISNPVLNGSYSLSVSGTGSFVDSGSTKFLIYRGVGISVTIEGEDEEQPESTTGDVFFEGKAYPGAFMTILVDGAVYSTFSAFSDGTFSGAARNVSSGIHEFGIYAQDANGNVSPTLSFSINVPAGSQIYVRNIFMPPTIESSGDVEQGGDIEFSGQAFPESNIFLFVDPGSIVIETTADANGNWQISLNTDNLEPGDYTANAKSVTESGEQSDFSETVNFEITEAPEEPEPEPEEPDEPGPGPGPGPTPPRDDLLCPNGDLNGDGIVNIVDVSIWVFWLNTDDSCADQNNDGIVDIFDLSIIIYYWR